MIEASKNIARRKIHIAFFLLVFISILNRKKKLKSVPDMADVHEVMSNGTFDVALEKEREDSPSVEFV